MWRYPAEVGSRVLHGCDYSRGSEISGWVPVAYIPCRVAVLCRFVGRARRHKSPPPPPPGASQVRVTSTMPKPARTWVLMGYRHL